MKIRPSIIWFCVAIFLLIVLVLLFGKPRHSATPQVNSTEAKNLAQPTVTPSLPPSGNLVHTNTSIAPSAKGIGLSKSPPMSKEERAIGILSTYNDVPINFYGKVEDQFSNTVAGVQINFEVRIINGYESTVKRGQVFSAADGLFRILGYRGQDLGFMPKKAGYALATTSTFFKYSRMEDHPFVPDSNNPIVIKMWKLQGAEPLVGINQHYKLHYTNAPVNFDLLAGKIVPDGGDIQLTINRSSGVMSGRNRPAWSVQVTAVDGGLMDSGGQERVTYAAPEDGYQPSMTFTFSTNAPLKWTSGFDQGFFLMSRNGQMYSKLGLGFEINRNPDGFMYVTFGGIASTNGSRNWEGDDNTMKAIGQ